MAFLQLSWRVGREVKRRSRKPSRLLGFFEVAVVLVRCDHSPVAPSTRITATCSGFIFLGCADRARQ